MTKKTIGVVGAGVAGLSAAYTLLKHGNVNVEVFEAKPFIGGRIQSRKVHGQMVDFGGFLIYPWYKNCHALLKEIGIDDLLSKTPIKEIYYVLDKKNVPVTLEEIPFSSFEKLQIWSKSLFRLLPEKDVAEPGLDRFNRLTIAEYLRSSLGRTSHGGLFETYFDTVNQGYCYGPVISSKAAFMAPIFRQTTLYGDVRSTSYFSEGTCLIAYKLAEEIAKLGGLIHLNKPVESVKGKVLHSGKDKHKFDGIIFAQNVSPDLYRDILLGVEPDCWYTHFVTATVKLDVLPKCRATTDWGALFYVPDENLHQQVLSVINLDVLYGSKLKNYFTVNVIIRGDRAKPLAVTKMRTQLKQELLKLYPECSTVKIEEFIHWEKTMPVAEESFVAAVREAQGKNGYYFAGDFLGAPSIETAISTGISAARNALSDFDSL